MRLCRFNYSPNPYLEHALHLFPTKDSLTLKKLRYEGLLHFFFAGLFLLLGRRYPPSATTCSSATDRFLKAAPAPRCGRQILQLREKKFFGSLRGSKGKQPGKSMPAGWSSARASSTCIRIWSRSPGPSGPKPCASRRNNCPRRPRRRRPPWHRILSRHASGYRHRAKCCLPYWP